MQSPLFLFLVLFATSLFGQAPAADSMTVVKQVDSLIQVSRELTSQGEYEKAHVVTSVAEILALEHFGRESVAYGKCCYNQGRIFQWHGDNIDAEKWYLDAVNIRAKVLGKEHSSYATSLFSLAGVYFSKGDYTRAVSAMIEAKDIRGKVLGKDHPEYVNCIGNLAIYYCQEAEYGKAEPLMIETMHFYEKQQGNESSLYAQSLTNLAFLYANKGDYAKAELLSIEAKDINAKEWGKNKKHNDYGLSLHNLAELYLLKGDYNRSEQYFKETIKVWSEVLGKDHVKYGLNLTSLAQVYNIKGDYAEAEPLFVEALGILEKKLGKEHPDYAWNLNHMASLYMHKGDFNHAEQLFSEAKAINAKALGNEHPQYATNVYNLANLYFKKGDYVKAKPLFLEHIQISKRLIDQSAAYSSESQQTIYLHFFDERVNSFYAFTQAFSDTAMVRAAYNNALFFSGYLLENSRHLTIACNSADSLTKATYLDWQAARRRLAQEYAKPIAERNKLLAETEAEAEGYEKVLTRSLNGFAENRVQSGWEQVRDRLQPDEAAVEFVRYNCNPDGIKDSIMYSALVLQAGWESPKWATLIDEKQLDALLSGRGARKSDYVNKLYTIAEEPAGSGQKTLYQLLWKPLEPLLSNAHTIYYASAGLMHRINLGAVPFTASQTLSDRFRIIPLGSTRQLIRPFTDTQPIQGDEAILMGGIQYDTESTTISLANATFNYERNADRGGLDFDIGDSLLRGGAWNYLPFTEKEIRSIVRILKVSDIKPVQKQGFDATEEYFKAIKSPSPRILHIATHGYFFPDAKTVQRTNLIDGEPIFKLSDHPMIRSGLILAGGNHAWKTGKPYREGMEDGILTAYEISQMDLSKTELVVLSACETGLGDIQGNEGVYGLQRAFKIAGAKYLIMSLWQVPDFQTQELMTAFYTNWLTKQMAIPDAFRAAQQAMREKYEHPYFWAGFVLVE